MPVLSAVCAVINVVFSCKSVKSSRKSSESAKISADSAEEANRIAKSNLHLQLDVNATGLVTGAEVTAELAEDLSNLKQQHSNHISAKLKAYVKFNVKVYNGGLETIQIMFNGKVYKLSPYGIFKIDFDMYSNQYIIPIPVVCVDTAKVAHEYVLFLMREEFGEAAEISGVAQTDKLFGAFLTKFTLIEDLHADNLFEEKYLKFLGYNRVAVRSLDFAKIEEQVHSLRAQIIQS